MSDPLNWGSSLFISEVLSASQGQLVEMRSNFRLDRYRAIIDGNSGYLLFCEISFEMELLLEITLFHVQSTFLNNPTVITIVF